MRERLGGGGDSEREERQDIVRENNERERARKEIIRQT